MSNEKEFIKLFVAAERRILGYLITMFPAIEDAEELMQETSIVIWEKFDEFLATQSGDPDLDRFTAWACKIAFSKRSTPGGRSELRHGYLERMFWS